MSSCLNHHTHPRTWGGYFTKLSVGGCRVRWKKLTQSDLNFWKNKGSNRSQNNKNSLSLDWKLRKRLVENASKWSNNRFWGKLYHIISGTKCDRDKLIFLRMMGSIRSSYYAYKGEPRESENVKKGDNRADVPYIPSRTMKYVTPPPLQVLALVGVWPWNAGIRTVPVPA